MPHVPQETTIAFVGTGVMGAAMAGHLIEAGYRLVVHNRTAEKAAPLVAAGARFVDSPGAAAEEADFTITMVGYPADVEQVYLAENGVVARAKAGSVLIDMTTSSPELAMRIHDGAAAVGLYALDAPVSGGDVGAKNATLTIMAGGDEFTFSEALPIFQILGKTALLHGGPGAGQHCKMANQIAIAASMLGMAECLAYARAAGLDAARVIETLSGGSAASWTLANYGPRVLAGDFAPGFYVKHFVKDLKIALAEAESMGIDVPGTALAKRLYQELEAGGGSDLGTQAIWLLYADAAQREAHGVSTGISALQG
jgi:3-hydroxyisobutyrate dehydrogenase